MLAFYRMDSFHLLCEEFSQNATNTFRSQFEKEDFADVTLACDDELQIKSHRIVLSSSSLFFQNVFKSNPQQNLVVFLKGVQSDVLRNILKFIYFGEAKINKGELKTFLTVAEDLQISGLFNQNHIMDEPVYTKNGPTEKRRRNRRKKSEPIQESLSENINVPDQSEPNDSTAEEFPETISTLNVTNDLMSAEDRSDYIEVVDIDLEVPESPTRGSQNPEEYPDIVSETVEAPCEMIKCKICALMIPNIPESLMQHVTEVHGAQ